MHEIKIGTMFKNQDFQDIKIKLLMENFLNIKPIILYTTYNFHDKKKKLNSN